MTEQYVHAAYLMWKEESKINQLLTVDQEKEVSVVSTSDIHLRPTL